MSPVTEYLASEPERPALEVLRQPSSISITLTAVDAPATEVLHAAPEQVLSTAASGSSVYADNSESIPLVPVAGSAPSSDHHAKPVVDESFV